MSTRKPIFNGILIALASLVVGMVIASRLDLTPSSFASSLNMPTANTAPISGPIDATTFRNIAHETNPSVVSIQIEATRPAQQSFGDLFGFGSGSPFQGQPPTRRGQGQGRRGPQTQQDQPQEILQGAGSGFIIDKNGYILTNNHVVEDANSITVHLAGMNDLEDGLPAKVVGRDPLADVALIQITQLPAEPLVPIKFGDSSQMQPGDWVMAIGNPFTLSNTVTVGVVSAVGREQQSAASSGRYEEYIQTDAAINRGNSGGPLLNVRGEVIGINTMILTDQGEGNVGVGFAIPINHVNDLLPQLKTGKVTRGLIGVSVDRRPLTQELANSYGLPSRAGAVVLSVTKGGPGDNAGVRADDVIVSFNGKAVSDDNQLVSMVQSTTPGTTVPVKLYRDGKLMSVNIKVQELDLQAESETTGGSDDTTPAQPAPSAPRVEPKTTDFGMALEAITPQIARELNLPSSTHTGVVVSRVDPLGSAARAGLGQGDVILSINGTAVSTPDAAAAALAKVATGRTARIVISRGGEETLVLVQKR
jgi:serine protease Do